MTEQEVKDWLGVGDIAGKTLRREIIDGMAGIPNPATDRDHIEVFTAFLRCTTYGESIWEPPARPSMRLDPIGWYIATMHQLLGHDKAAAALGVPPFDKADCLICRYESTGSNEDILAVAAALAPQE